MAETIGRVYLGILADGKDFAIDVKRVVREKGADLDNAGEEAGNKYSDGFNKGFKKRIQAGFSDLKKKLKGEERTFEKIGNGIGRAFGKGSRNDFLNAFGSFVSLGPRLVQSFFDMSAAVGSFFDRIRQIRKDSDNFKNFLANLATEGLPGLIAAAAAAALALGATIALMGPMASAVSLVLGMVLALAGSLSFALVGGLVAVAGALIPFAAALGVAAIAIGGIDKKSQVFKDLKKDWKDLKKETSQALFGSRDQFGKPMANLQSVRDVLKALKPIILTVADAMGGLLKSLGEQMKNPAVVQVLDDINAVIGPMVTTLGQIGGNLLLFLGEAFVAASPIIEEFLGWLLGVSEAMVEFGKGGTESPLAKWFNDAWESAKIVGAFILELIGLVGDLFGLGKDTGDSLFADLTKQVRKIRDWLADPKNKDTIKQWFEDAKRLGRQLGRIVVKAIEFVDALDTPLNRKILEIVLGILETMFDVLTWLVDKWNEFWQIVKKVVDFLAAHTWVFSALFGPMISAIEVAIEAFGRLFGVFSLLIGGSDKVKSAFDRLKTGADTAKGGVKGLGDQVKTTEDVFGRASEQMKRDASSAGSSINKSLKGSFDGLAGEVSRAKTTIGSVSDVDLSNKMYSLGHKAGRSFAAGLRDALKNAIQNALSGTTPNSFHPTASGAVVNNPEFRLIGEAGPEAVVPLNRPLSMVDPAVRQLSAFAQGIRTTGGSDVNTPVNRTLVGAITIITPTEDPRAVASEVVARMAAATYLS